MIIEYNDLQLDLNTKNWPDVKFSNTEDVNSPSFQVKILAIHNFYPGCEQLALCFEFPNVMYNADSGITFVRLFAQIQQALQAIPTHVTSLKIRFSNNSRLCAERLFDGDWYSYKLALLKVFPPNICSLFIDEIFFASLIHAWLDRDAEYTTALDSLFGLDFIYTYPPNNGFTPPSTLLDASRSMLANSNKAVLLLGITAHHAPRLYIHTIYGSLCYTVYVSAERYDSLKNDSDNIISRALQKIIGKPRYYTCHNFRLLCAWHVQAQQPKVYVPLLLYIDQCLKGLYGVAQDVMLHRAIELHEIANHATPALMCKDFFEIVFSTNQDLSALCAGIILCRNLLMQEILVSSLATEHLSKFLLFLRSPQAQLILQQHDALAAAISFMEIILQNLLLNLDHRSKFHANPELVFEISQHRYWLIKHPLSDHDMLQKLPAITRQKYIDAQTLFAPMYAEQRKTAIATESSKTDTFNDVCQGLAQYIPSFVVG